MTLWSDSILSPLRQTVHRKSSRLHRGRAFNWRLMLALAANAVAWTGIIYLVVRFP